MTRPTYRPVDVPGLGTAWRTSDGSTFASEADAALHADPEPELPEWRHMADTEPYRLAVGGRSILAGRPLWTVTDCRTAETVAGPFRTREAAAARADELNARHRADAEPMHAEPELCAYCGGPIVAQPDGTYAHACAGDEPDPADADASPVYRDAERITPPDPAAAERTARAHLRPRPISAEPLPCADCQSAGPDAYPYDAPEPAAYLWREDDGAGSSPLCYWHAAERIHEALPYGTNCTECGREHAALWPSELDR